MSNVVVEEPKDITEAIDTYIDNMKLISDGMIDKHRYYWYNWALRDTFKAGMEFQRKKSDEQPKWKRELIGPVGPKLGGNKK